MLPDSLRFANITQFCCLQEPKIGNERSIYVLRPTISCRFSLRFGQWKVTNGQIWWWWWCGSKRKWRINQENGKGSVFRRVRKIAKRDYRFDKPACPFFCPHTRLPLDGFSWNFISEDFPKISRENSSWLNLTTITGTVYEYLCTFMVIARWILLRMRNISNKTCGENINTHFMFNKFFL